jgi:hypothetical protein
MKSSVILLSTLSAAYGITINHVASISFLVVVDIPLVYSFSEMFNLVPSMSDVIVLSNKILIFPTNNYTGTIALQ